MTTQSAPRKNASTFSVNYDRTVFDGYYERVPVIIANA